MPALDVHSGWYHPLVLCTLLVLHASWGLVLLCIHTRVE